MFRRSCWICCLQVILAITANAQAVPANLSEDQVGKYYLPDPLRMQSGKLVSSTREWNARQRPYILKLFEKNVYGKFPPAPMGLTFILNSVDSNALEGTAICKQVTVYFTRYDISTNMDILLYLPKAALAPVPVFLACNFGGNQTVSADTAIILNKNWMYPGKGISSHHATDSTRGSASTQWNVPALIARGYGLATVYYGDLEPDHADGWKTGVRTKMATALQTQPQEWSAIGAWAWGLSRVMDYLKTDKLVNAKQVIVMGHSRLGKAALWAGASDPRFAIVISNESGEGGAALSKRNFGENTSIITQRFPHWFAPAYKKFANRPASLPLDQHMLLALVAPRPLYVTSAVEDQWSDPKGEFLSARFASPVYALFHKKGLESDSLPPLNEPAGGTLRYHIRSGKHDVTDFDWQQYMDFADEMLGYHFAVRQAGNEARTVYVPAKF